MGISFQRTRVGISFQLSGMEIVFQNIGIGIFRLTCLGIFFPKAKARNLDTILGNRMYLNSPRVHLIGSHIRDFEERSSII